MRLVNKIQGMAPSVLAVRAMSVKSPGVAPIRRAFAPKQTASSTVPTISLVPSVVVQMASRANRGGTSTATGQEIAAPQRQQSAISTVPTISLVLIVVVQMALRANHAGTSTAAGPEIAAPQSVQLQTP